MPHRVAAPDQGAIAVLTAILSFLLFGVSALAVDLGNMYARSGDAQSAADLAALAGAAVLVPDTDRRNAIDVEGARAAAHASLVQNAVYSDGSGFDLPGISDPAWTQNGYSDGQIDVDVDTMRVTVVLPPRTVRFGLAAIFGIGQSAVSARAVAEVRAPGQLLPFYLPDQPGCRTESQFLAATEASLRELVFRPEPSTKDGVPVLVPDTLAPTPNGEITIVGENFQETGMEVQFALGSQNVIVKNNAITSVQRDPSGPDRLVVEVPRRVRTTPGLWAILVKNSEGWGGANPNPNPPPLHIPVLFLGIEMTIVDDCLDPNLAGYLGLFSPDIGAADLTTNIVNGLSDGLRVDDTVTIYPAGLAAQDAEEMKDALVGSAGRLAADTPTDCAELRNVQGVNINNDVLSCFIDNQPPNHPGHSVEGTLADDCDGFPASPNPHEGRSLKSSIFDSPRFFFIPVLAAPFAPTGPVGDVEVTEFRAVFLTDETEGDDVVGSEPESDATADNGVSLQRSEIDRITVYAFCPDELPNAVAEQGGSGFPWQPGLPTAIRLVE
jgi:Putative Flp pilus-assembly TadE/G-like